MTAIEQSKRITIDDYEAYPENERIEVFEGKELYAKRYTFDDNIKVGIYEDLYIDFAPLKELL